jgi:hypothetical protein
MSTVSAPRFRSQRVRKAYTGRDVPQLWSLVLASWFAASPALAVELWRAYRAMLPHTSKNTAFELNRMFSACPEDVLWQRAEWLLALLCPRDLLAVSLRLAQEGHRRRRDVLLFEEAVLERLDADGKPSFWLSLCTGD